MGDGGRYRPHKVRREDRADGTILLRSGYPMGPVTAKTADWLHRWAAERPDHVFLAEREGEGWRSVTYAQALPRARALAAGLLARGMGADTPILIISGNGLDHGLLSLAAQYVGVPTVPVAEQYALIPGAHDQLRHVIALTSPAMVYAVDGARFAEALALPELAGLDRVVSTAPGPGETPFADLAAAETPDLDAAAARVGPDTVAKILMTSGSTSSPKGVLTTQAMMCANQAQLSDALPFLSQRPPVIVDWLPWNHVFGGSHNFNMMLANGGSLYIDDGKPVKALVARTVENQRLAQGTIAFNVPIGFAMLRDALKADAELRAQYFGQLDMLFYAGASLPQDLWRDLEDMAREVRGEVPLMTSSWGLTETAPACLIQHEPIDRSGIVGVPVTGVTLKLLPQDDGRYEARVKGPNLFEGYLDDPQRTAEAFDEEGFFVTGDAMALVDPDDMARGLRFDGRISEEFKLTSGTWVRAAALRMELLALLAPLAQDVVITGADRAEVGLLVFPNAEGVGDAGFTLGGAGGAVTDAGVMAEVARRLATRRATGSASRIARALILSEPASIAAGEITAKGSLNFRKILTRRGDLVDRLHAGDGPGVIVV